MNYYANNYAYYSISGSNLSIGKDVYIAEPWKAPAVCTLDLHSSYHFNLGGFKATLTGQVNNLFNNYYIEKAWNPISISKKENPIVNEDDVYMFYSLGRTWSLRLKVDF
jgi:outer membrane receptor protein involved in Fe transport